MVRYWDLAATDKTALNDQDWTIGIELGRDRNGGYWLLDVARTGEPGRRRQIVVRYRDTGRHTGSHRVRQGSEAGRQEPGASPGTRAQRLHRDAGGRERRQAHEVRAGQLAVPRRQRQDPAGRLERGPVPRPRRVPRSRS